MINFGELKFDERGLIPVVTQDYATKEVLMMAYMNEESIKLTVETGKVHYFSRSRQKLWLKGETSGHFQIVKEMFYDCDGDTILVKVEQIGGTACHTGAKSCFYRPLAEFAKEEAETVKDNTSIIDELYDLIDARKKVPVEGSYTNFLFAKGLDKILKKVGEECSETIIAAKNEDKDEIIYEVSDLVYHGLVLMSYFDITPEKIREELATRKK